MQGMCLHPLEILHKTLFILKAEEPSTASGFKSESQADTTSSLQLRKPGELDTGNPKV